MTPTRKHQQPEPPSSDETPNQPSDTETTNLIGPQLIAEARKFIGKPYVFGSEKTRTDQFDCSSFVWRIVGNKTDIKLPRTARDQQKYWVSSKKAVQVTFDKASLKPGDVLYWSYSTSGHRLPSRSTRAFI